MHNAILSDLLTNTTDKQFWIKPVGIPFAPVGEHPEAAQDTIRVDFSTNPYHINVGDILFVYVIHASRLLYVAETTAAANSATDEEIKKEAWRERWHWGIEGRNLTPDFGKDWVQHGISPFVLKNEYNALHPKANLSLGALQFGRDKVKIPDAFAAFMLERIMSL